MSCFSDSNPLAALPPSILREVEDRLRRGEPVSKVTRWLMVQPRGPFRHEGHYDIQQRVSALREEIYLQDEEAEKKPGICGESSSRDQLEASAATPDRMDPDALLLVAVTDARAEIEFARAQREQGIAVDTSKARADLFRISEVMRSRASNIDSLSELCLKDTEQAPGVTAELKESLQTASDADRMLLRKWFETVLTMVDLQRQLHGLQTEKNAAQTAPDEAAEESCKRPNCPETGGDRKAGGGTTG